MEKIEEGHFVSGVTLEVKNGELNTPKKSDNRKKLKTNNGTTESDPINQISTAS